MVEMQNALRELRNHAEIYMPRLPFHNYAHAFDVAGQVRRLGIIERVSDDEITLLQSAAYLHDIIYVVGATDNEEKSAHYAERLLRDIKYGCLDIQIVANCIRATKLPTNPRTLLEKILCDADLDNLGREDFLEKNNALKEEFGRARDPTWYYKTLDFLQGHRWYTPSAQMLRQKGLERNIAHVREIINNFPR